MSDNNKKVEEKAAEIIQATETQTVKPAAAEDKEFKKKKSTTWERNQRKWGWAFILPTMIGIIVLNLWPIVQTIYQSFCKVGSFGTSTFAGFDNYKKMLANRRYGSHFSIHSSMRSLRFHFQSPSHLYLRYS